MNVLLRMPGLIIGLTALLLSANATAGIKCWTNSDGVRECGNILPPEYAQQEHETKSEQGITVKTMRRAKTKAELKIDKELAREEAEKQRLAKIQTAKDRVLLDTFSSQDDMEFARDGQISNLDSQIRLTMSHSEKLEKNLDQMISRAADLERRGQIPSEKTTDDIANVRAQIVDNLTFIDTKHKEQEEIRGKFEMDIMRFRELKSSASMRLQ